MHTVNKPLEKKIKNVSRYKELVYKIISKTENF